MVSPVMQEALRSLSSQELDEVRLFIDQLDSADRWELAEGEQRLIRQRDAEMDADPSLAVPAREMISRIRASRPQR
ncbi:MAG: hypothetical protein LBI99_09015 [Propionibacteriaceae bacterium]|jgi:hypothetical protein|nr:hypothetical protein [Propionibacteriaceae bacterium]